MMEKKTAIRSESDSLGECSISGDVYYGIHTFRALENFSISGTSISSYPDFIKALAAIKQAAATTNRELGLLDDRVAGAIARACKSVWSGYYHDQFVVDVLQGGAGASTNMNANEVVANLALEFLDLDKGDYEHIHPLNHVNLNQSTHDVYPTAVKLALIFQLENLILVTQRMQDTLSAKAIEFQDVIKMGRTQLLDAVPMTLGDEFRHYVTCLRKDETRIEQLKTELLEIHLGNVALGAGIKAHQDYAARVCKHLANITRLPIIAAPNKNETSDDIGVFVNVSGVVKGIAITVSKMCNDLRLLSSGPKAGLNEIRFPAIEGGSDVLPDGINPAVAETVNQVAFEVIGNDMAVSSAAESGQLQLNAFTPIIAHSLFQSITHLSSAIALMDERCVRGIEANRNHSRNQVEDSIGMVALLTPYIGYRDAAELSIKALASNKKVTDLAIEMKLLSQAQLDQILKPEALIKSLSTRLV